MSTNDTIADLLTRIRNGKSAQHRFVDVPLSKMNQNIVKLLKDLGFIDNYLVNQDKRVVRLFLRYKHGRDSVIKGLKRVSSPGLRRYVGYKDIPRVLGGLGAAILSTPQGVIDGETARRNKVGGELLCYVW